jgi:hypothetical protein
LLLPTFGVSRAENSKTLLFILFFEELQLLFGHAAAPPSKADASFIDDVAPKDGHSRLVLSGIICGFSVDSNFTSHHTHFYSFSDQFPQF